MKCDHCNRQFETYDGLYHHVCRYHGLVVQAEMPSPAMEKAMGTPKLRIVMTPRRSESVVERMFTSNGDEK